MVGITSQVVGGRHVEGVLYCYSTCYSTCYLLLYSLDSLTHSRRTLMKKSRASARHTAPTTM